MSLRVVELGETDLPSARAAKALVGGDLTAIGPVIGWTSMRALLIGSGLLLAGQRQGVIKGAVVASLTIEAWILAWAALDKKA